MTQILITIPDGTPGCNATVLTVMNGDYTVPASGLGKGNLRNCIDATREATRYYQTALRSENIENGGKLDDY